MAKESKKLKASGNPSYTVPGLSNEQGGEVAAILQNRLNALTDLHLTLKHVHWNVVGPHFISVHQMLDPQVDAVREMADAVAERIATLGASPVGTPAALVADRDWDDYSIGRAGAIEHLGALDLVYAGVIKDHRSAIEAAGEIDPVTEDLLTSQSGVLEQYHWFVRAHLETAGGELSTAGADTEVQATRKAGERAGVKRQSA
ncbi:DNA starvation/stationary phase protection protein [Paenibacillus sp. TRM 82003]|uniref:Dps family protein n=1 Tax=Kineococcus sp. TRM81007 TaxID=2925831 RepID=UPI001F56B2DC|nr:DNA starvation/stationary phase protection protein [Kineococcus sp. TRM81007]MCI2239188.1 DNA starvation/stationary phase protection protein [Kineococcus sp. TRM81007]MCI3924867.1 DNA starvation/stationary phase protection protein [Paenibacillus sp. TRM 82003]